MSMSDQPLPHLVLPPSPRSSVLVRAGSNRTAPHASTGKLGKGTQARVSSAQINRKLAKGEEIHRDQVKIAPLTEKTVAALNARYVDKILTRRQREDAGNDTQSVMSVGNSCGTGASRGSAYGKKIVNTWRPGMPTKLLPWEIQTIWLRRDKVRSLLTRAIENCSNPVMREALEAEFAELLKQNRTYADDLLRKVFEYGETLKMGGPAYVDKIMGEVKEHMRCTNGKKCPYFATGGRGCAFDHSG